MERARILVLSGLDELGYELVDIVEKFARSDYLVSIVVWKQGGIGIEDCVEITHKIHPMLETDGVIPDYVRLEVSSPGIDRKFKNLNELNIFKGLTVTLNLENRTQVTGTDMGITADSVTLDVDGKLLVVPLSNITSAKLVG